MNILTWFQYIRFEVEGLIKRLSRDRWLLLLEPFFICSLSRKYVVKWQHKSITVNGAESTRGILYSILYLDFFLFLLFLSLPSIWSFSNVDEMLQGKLLSTVHNADIPRSFLRQPPFYFISFENQKIQRGLL